MNKDAFWPQVYEIASKILDQSSLFKLFSQINHTVKLNMDRESIFWRGVNYGQLYGKGALPVDNTAF